MAAKDQFLGPGAQPFEQLYGNRAGQQIGWRTTTRMVRDDGDHFNFQNLQTGGNLHVYFPSP